LSSVFSQLLLSVNLTLNGVVFQVGFNKLHLKESQLFLNFTNLGPDVLFVFIFVLECLLILLVFSLDFIEFLSLLPPSVHTLLSHQLTPLVEIFAILHLLLNIGSVIIKFSCQPLDVII
jgi:hypothetical protein